MLWRRSGLVSATTAFILLAVTPVLAQLSPLEGGPRVILSFGNDQFIPKAAIEATTGARFQSDFTGLRFLDEVSVIVLSDIPFAQLPPLLHSSLARWVELGGSLLFTGGNNSFGLGGYAGTPLASLLPLMPRENERTGHGFSPTYVLDQNHPLFTGVTTSTMANFNETRLTQGANLLLEYRGVSKGGAAGAGITGSGKPFTTVTARTSQTPGGTPIIGGATGSPSSIVVLGPGIQSGVAGTPGVGGQGSVPVPTIVAGTAVNTGTVLPGGTVVTPGTGGQGGAIGLPVAPAAPSSSLVASAAPPLSIVPSSPLSITAPVTSIGVGTSATQSVTVGLPSAPPPPSPADVGQQPTPGITTSTAITGPTTSISDPTIGQSGLTVGPPIAPPPGPIGLPSTPTPTTTPGVLGNPVTPVSGTLEAGGIPPGAVISTAPGAVPGTVAISQAAGLPGQNPLLADPGFAGEGGIQGGGRATMPLIAERRQGQGTVLAIALDMNATGEWQDRDNLTVNAVRYLLDQSKLPLLNR